MPTPEAVQLDETLQAQLYSINNDLEKSKKLTGAERKKCLDDLQSRVNEAKKNHRQFKLEAREQTKAEQKEYEEKAKTHGKTIVELSSAVATAQVTRERGDLLDGGSAGVDANSNMTAAEMLQEAENITKETKSSTDRSVAMLSQALNTGAETAAMLHDQTKQMENTNAAAKGTSQHATGASDVLTEMERPCICILFPCFNKPRPKRDKIDEVEMSKSGGSKRAATVPSAQGSRAPPGSTVSKETSELLSEEANANIKAADDNLDIMSGMLGQLGAMSKEMNDEVKKQAVLTDEMHENVDKANEEVEVLNDRTEKLLGRKKK